MKKIISFLIIFLILTAATIISYWTGIETERQFTFFNERFYPANHLKLLESTFQRGWLHSTALSTFETNIQEKTKRFIFVHEIDHGFVPIQPIVINTRLHAFEPDAPLSETINKAVLLKAHTIVQINGDSLSTLKVPAFAFKDEVANLQGQNIQGNIFVKENSIIQAEIDSPQIQIDGDQGKVVIEGITFNADLENYQQVMQGVGRLSITDVRLTAQQIPPIHVEGIKLIGDSKIINDYLAVKLKTDLQQIQIDADRYGRSYGDIEIHHWHLPTLKQIKTTWEEIRHQDFSPSQEATIAKFRLMPLALTFLNKSPELALTNLNVKTPQGELRGGLQIKMKPFKGGFFAILNPSSLINALDAQLELHIPQSLLDILIEDENVHNIIRQRLKAWKEKGILRLNDAGYYDSQIQLSNGILQVNGEQRLIATILFE
ncbi:MAG: DUF945 family protein [Thiomargarita sp.]|nr:DUF945 family protein [Thiomargarita sp.]